MSKSTGCTAAVLVGAIGLGLLAPIAAEAGSKGRRNTAIALGAVAAYGIVKKKPAVAGIAGAGAIYSYMKSRSARKSEQRRDRNRRYRGSRYTRHRRPYYRDRYRGDRHYRTARYHEHDDDCGLRPPGWSKGKKKGWGGRGMPPGQAKKYYSRGRHDH